MSLPSAVEAMLGQQRPGRVIGGNGELYGDGRLRRAVTNHAAFGAHAERHAERVEQDRFAGSGLAGEDAESGMEGELEALDQDEIPDRQAEQHVTAMK